MFQPLMDPLGRVSGPCSKSMHDVSQRIFLIRMGEKNSSTQKRAQKMGKNYEIPLNPENGIPNSIGILSQLIGIFLVEKFSHLMDQGGENEY